MEGAEAGDQPLCWEHLQVEFNLAGNQAGDQAMLLEEGAGWMGKTFPWHPWHFESEEPARN